MDITRDYFYGRFPVKFAKLSKIFWKVFRFRGSELLVYNERTFSRPRYHREEPYMMGSLFEQIPPSAAARNPT